MTSRAWPSALLAGALLLGASYARAQVATDPLTGATPDHGAALGKQSYEPVYFDAQGNVTDNAKEAVKYAITDNVQGMSTLPKPIGQMTPEDRQKLGLAEPPAEKTASTDKPAEKPADKPAEKPKPATQVAEAPKEDENTQIVKGTEETDPDTGLVYGEVKPQLVEAAKESFNPSEGGASVQTAAADAPEGAPAQKWVAPAVASQMDAVLSPASAPKGYRALNTLVSLRAALASRLQAFLGKGGEAGLAGYGILYDGAAARVAPALEQRASDGRFGVGQNTAE
ncbi:MAG: hypothetical protein HY925_13145 [Elusimicrobia bacterium]|nr:hypothetical protein [Elusimicrobiota bacterium]